MVNSNNVCIFATDKLNNLNNIGMIVDNTDGKIRLNGNEYATYEVSNETLVEIVRDCKGNENNLRLATETIVERFKNTLCKRNGEGNEEIFARIFSEFVNGKIGNKHKVAEMMAREHRYLQNEMFKVCLGYIEVLAENCEKKYYDPRNQYAVRTSKKIIDFLNDKPY